VLTLRVALFAVIAGAVAGLVWTVGRGHAGALAAVLALPGAFAAAMAWAFTRTEASTLVDLREGWIRTPETWVAFDDVKGLAIRTWLEVRRNTGRSGGGFANLGQRWSILLHAKREEPITLATHGSEYALLAAARRLAEVLGVPVLDASGVPGTVAGWRPGDGTVTVEAAGFSLREWSRTGVRITHYRAGAGGDGRAPDAHDGRDPVRALKESRGPEGLTLTWRRTGGAIVAALAAALVGGAAWFLWRYAATDHRWAAGAALVLSVLLLLGALRAVAERSVDAITVGRNAIVATGRFPVRWRRRVALDAIDDVRASARHSLDQQFLGDAATERVRQVRIDLLGVRGPLLRLWTWRADAGPLFEALRRQVDTGARPRRGRGEPRVAQGDPP
jgi:hypothetical protein